MNRADRPGTGPISAEDIRRLCGDVLDWKVKAIIETGGSLDDLQAALAWAAGEDDVMGEARKPLSGDAAAIYDVLTADAFDEDEPPAPA